VYGQSQFWDGRAATLEDQSIGPFVNPVEHGFLNHDEMVAKMRKIRGYRTMFKEVFGRDIVIEDVGRAIASFQRTILSGNSPADRFDYGGLSYSAARRAAFDAIPTSTFPMKSSITSASGGIRTPWTLAAIW
jgi:cytochrome c peroxidase